MTGAELEDYFRVPWDDVTAEAVPTPDLSDRQNLYLFGLMELYKNYPNIQVFTEPVERWPRQRHRDFTAIMLARARAKEVDSAIDDVWTEATTMGDPSDWKGLP